MPVVIGIPKEVKEQEFRVALLPSAVNQLVKRGHRVLVETDAGAGIGYHDSDYGRRRESFPRTRKSLKRRNDRKGQGTAGLGVRIAPSGQILFTYLHLAANRSLTECLLTTGATCIAYETVEAEPPAAPP